MTMKQWFVGEDRQPVDFNEVIDGSGTLTETVYRIVQIDGTSPAKFLWGRTGRKPSAEAVAEAVGLTSADPVPPERVPSPTGAGKRGGGLAIADGRDKSDSYLDYVGGDVEPIVIGAADALLGASDFTWGQNAWAENREVNVGSGILYTFFDEPGIYTAFVTIRFTADLTDRVLRIHSGIPDDTRYIPGELLYPVGAGGNKTEFATVYTLFITDPETEGFLPQVRWDGSRGLVTTDATPDSVWIEFKRHFVQG